MLIYVSDEENIRPTVCRREPTAVVGQWDQWRLHQQLYNAFSDVVEMENLESQGQYQQKGKRPLKKVLNYFFISQSKRTHLYKGNNSLSCYGFNYSSACKYIFNIHYSLEFRQLMIKFSSLLLIVNFNPCIFFPEFLKVLRKAMEYCAAYNTLKVKFLDLFFSS